MGIIYLVDSANHRWFEESRIELEDILEIPELEKVPIVILRNEWNKGARPMDVFMSSVTKKKGYNEGFKWLSNFLKWMIDHPHLQHHH